LGRIYSTALFSGKQCAIVLQRCIFVVYLRLAMCIVFYIIRSLSSLSSSVRLIHFRLPSLKKKKNRFDLSFVGRHCVTPIDSRCWSAGAADTKFSAVYFTPLSLAFPQREKSFHCESECVRRCVGGPILELKERTWNTNTPCV